MSCCRTSELAGPRSTTTVERDFSDYSIPDLQEALATIDGRAHPENKAALERELQARKDSGEFDRYMAEARQAEREQHARRVGFAKTMRKVIGGYLVISAVYAIAGVSLAASGSAAGLALLAFMILFLAASFVSGVGLLMKQSWAHWIAVVVLGLQVLKIQFPGFSMEILSLIGIYLFVDGDFSIGITAMFDPGVSMSVGHYAPLWIGVNIFCGMLLGYLFTAREQVD